jgi:hypothetical protein
MPAPSPPALVVVPTPGPPGPQGPAGSTVDVGLVQGLIDTSIDVYDSASHYVHTQSSPSASWVIDHNLGRKVHVTLLDPLGRVVYSDVEHGSDNQATVIYPTPVAGYAVIS